MVNEFKVVTIMNDAMLKTLKESQQNYDENLKIQKYLKDETFFFKIKKRRRTKCTKKNWSTRRTIRKCI